MMTITDRLAQEAAEEERAKKINWDKLNMQLNYIGKTITLPGDPAKMPLKEAIKTLQRFEKDEMTEVNVHEIIDAYPLDAAVAFVKAMQRLYGWASPVATPGFFGPQPPSYIGVKVGKNREDIVQCPLGSFLLPGVSRRIQTVIHPVHGFVIHGTVLQKERQVILELATETRRIVETESIYKGKAVRITLDTDDVFSTNTPPEFMDTSLIGEESLVFNADITEQINTNILVPIKFTELCKKRKIPLKRGILLEGPYGTGKSLTAAMVARVCEENGWTFVLLNRVQGLKAVLEFANRFKPAVVFAEDVDRIASDRDEAMNDLINTIDGVVSKRSEVMTVLTTNHADKLNPVILRPGRLDAVISLKAPDAATVRKLIVHYAEKLLPDKADLTASGEELKGQVPSSIRECVERAKLGMIGRGDNKLNDRDILIAAQTMKAHLALLNKGKDVKGIGEVLAETLHKVVNNGTGETIDKMGKQVGEIHENVC